MIQTLPTNNPLLFHKNKTGRYLRPVLGYYSEKYPEFFNLQKVCHPIVYGVADFFYDDITDNFKETIIQNNCLYIMLDLNGVYAFNKYIRKDFYRLNTLEFVKKFQALNVIKDFYPFDGDVDSQFWIITISIPEIFQNLMYNFLEGKYSKMYSSLQINYYIKKYIVVGNQKAANPIYQVLTKDESYKKIFEKNLIKEFRLKSDFTVADDIELDTPPILKDECFNLEYFELKNELSEITNEKV